MEAITEVGEFVTHTICTACNLEVQAVTLHSTLDELMLDSLGIISLVGQVEARYGCEFSELRIERLFLAQNLAEIVSIVSEVANGEVKPQAESALG
jgi:acyl carrier protein